MTRLPLLFAAIRAKLRRQPEHTAPVSPAPWAAEVPPFLLPTVRLPKRTPGMALIRERVALQMTGFMPHTSHQPPEHIIRVRPGWVVADVTAEFQAITSRLVDA